MINIETFQFAQPLWLWGFAAIPVIWLAFFLFYRPRNSSHCLESMIDKHLLPFLLVDGKTIKKSTWKFKLFSWSLIWGCLILALAGPRWSFRDIEMLSKDQSLIILLDLSESMDASDIKPSRLIRARQKIEDLIQSSHGVKIGLIAFAADPHMISPLTEDKETLRHLLPSLGTDLVYIQGSRLSPALNMASKMLEAEPGHQQALVIVSDGGFEDTSAIADVKKLAEKGIIIHAMGMGTVEGTVLQDSKGNAIKKNGKSVLSKLGRELLQEISKAGQGFYIEPRHSNHDESAILEQFQSNAEAVISGKRTRLWDEGFFYFLLPALPLFLFWFRRGMILAIMWIVVIPSFPLKAGIVQDYFMNSEEVGEVAFEKENYEEAAQAFQDPYRKGVACYRAGQFAEAEKMFKESVREEVARDAAYNLGNALAQQQKFQEAITAYEEVLKKWPEHQSAKENLELIKKMNQQQQQQQQNKDQQNDQKDDQENGKNEDSQEQKNDQSSDQEKKSECKDQQDEKPQNEAAEENSEQKNPKENEELTNEESKQKSQQDLDADVWLNRLSNDPKSFLKNKFYIESKKSGTKEGIDPW